MSEQQIRSALRGLVEAVSNMRVPQNVEEAAVQVVITIGPALECARAALRTPEAADAPKQLRCEMCADSKWKDACPECNGTGTPDPEPEAADAGAVAVPIEPTDDNYRNAIDTEMVLCHLGVATGDARADLNAIINWHVDVALDPRVSERARDLAAGIAAPPAASADAVGKALERAARVAQNFSSSSTSILDRQNGIAAAIRALAAPVAGADTKGGA